MTLEEAVAAYAIERDGILNELHPYAGKYPGTSIAWHRERDRLALDAAVRAVALAAARQPYTCLTEIECLLPEGSEKGEGMKRFETASDSKERVR